MAPEVFISTIDNALSGAGFQLHRKMILSRAAMPFILTLDEILFALRLPDNSGRLDLPSASRIIQADWICPAPPGGPAPGRPGFGRMRPPTARLQIQTECPETLRGPAIADPLVFRADWI